MAGRTGEAFEFCYNVVDVAVFFFNYREFIVWVFLPFPDRSRIFKSLDFIHPVKTVERENVRFLTSKQLVFRWRWGVCRVGLTIRQHHISGSVPNLDLKLWPWPTLRLALKGDGDSTNTSSLSLPVLRGEEMLRKGCRQVDLAKAWEGEKKGP